MPEDEPKQLDRKEWLELCEQAADEQDPRELARLILEINYFLEVKEHNLMERDLTDQAAKIG
jgi:hypothetical protein